MLYRKFYLPLVSKLIYMKKTILLLLFFSWQYQLIFSQSIILDKPVTAGELTLFPDMEDDKAYYYLPDKPKIAINAAGKPQFSFLRYVNNTDTGEEGEGGGIVHAVVILEVTPEQRRAAERDLQSAHPGAKIVGPVIYRDGTIGLISSIAQPNGDFAKQVIGLGKAPILDGQKAAISVQLNKLGAKILHGSFQTPTPDMSVSFEMVVSGYRMPKKAIIEANFDMVYEHKAFKAAVAAPILQAEINSTFDDLVKSGAIKVTNKGADEQMEKLIEDAYNKLTRMMFDASGGTGTPSLSQLASSAGGQRSLMDRASGLLNNSRREARADNALIRAENQRNRTNNSSRTTGTNAASDTSNAGRARMASYYSQRPRRTPSSHARSVDPANPALANGAAPQRQEVAVPQIAIAASFEMKRVRQKGTYRIDLEKWSADNMTLRFDENFGSIDCEECFVDINLDDPLYRQRELVASLDGMNATDFGSYINFVNVTMRKKHQNGDVTTDEVKIDRQNFNQTGNNFNLMYGWKGDNNRKNWANYEFKSIWNFFGGGSVRSDWQEADIQVIPLSPPYISKEILIDADPDRIVDADVRAIEVTLFYKVGDQELNKQLRLNTNVEEYSTKADIICPKSGVAYEYEVTWHLRDGSTRKTNRQQASSSLLFVDQIPQS